VVEDFYGTFTGYPFVLNAKFDSDKPELQKVLEVGWRTARLCAIETYMDCPFYEQLQYIAIPGYRPWSLTITVAMTVWCVTR